MMLAPLTYQLVYEKRPWTLNVERQGGNGRWFRQKLVKEWREKFAELATEAQLPRMAAVEITVIPYLRNRAAMPDTGACIGAAKAAIDGLVDAGVLIEDGPAVVRTLTFFRPIVGIDGKDKLVLEITEVPA